MLFSMGMPERLALLAAVHYSIGHDAESDETCSGSVEAGTAGVSAAMFRRQRHHDRRPANPAARAA